MGPCRSGARAGTLKACGGGPVRGATAAAPLLTDRVPAVALRIYSEKMRLMRVPPGADEQRRLADTLEGASTVAASSAAFLVGAALGMFLYDVPRTIAPAEPWLYCLWCAALTSGAGLWLLRWRRRVDTAMSYTPVELDCLDDGQACPVPPGGLAVNLVVTRHPDQGKISALVGLHEHDAPIEVYIAASDTLRRAAEQIGRHGVQR